MRDEPGRPPSSRLLAALGAASSLIVIFVAVLSIPLGTADELGLSTDETVGWILALYGVPSALTLVLVLRYRQPLVVTGNIFFLIFVASLGTDLTWPELVGASMAAGVIVLLLGPLGLTGWVATWLPTPIVFGLLGGAVLHFFVDLFTAADDEPLIVGAALLTYVASRRLVEPRIPAILPALVVGVSLAVVLGETQGISTSTVLPTPALTAPELSLSAIATATPVMVVLITLQANIPSIVFLRSEGYAPPDAVISAVSGIGTAAGSVLGPMGVSLSLPASALCAGPDAGPRETRHWSAYIVGAAGILIALLAALATEVAAALPAALLTGLVGLAVVAVLVLALRQLASGPLIWGPVFAFGISQSELELATLGPFFWALVGGLVVSLVLEREEWSNLRQQDGS